MLVGEWPYFPSECVSRGGELVGWAAPNRPKYAFQEYALDGLGHAAMHVVFEYMNAMTAIMRGKPSDRVARRGAHLFAENVSKSAVYLRDVRGLADGFAPSLYCHAQNAVSKSPKLAAFRDRFQMEKGSKVLDFFVATFPTGAALFEDHFECFLVPDLDRWFAFDGLPLRLEGKGADPRPAIAEAYHAMDRSGFVGTCGTADLPPKLRVAIHVRLGDLRGKAEETVQAVETLSSALQVAADLQHRQPTTKGKLHILVVSDSSAAELATALATSATKRKHPVRIKVQTARRWSDGVSHFDEATTTGLRPKDVALTFIGAGNPLVALDCLASAHVVLSPCVTSDPLFSHAIRKQPFEGQPKHTRCSNFVRMARFLSSGAFHGVPPRELDGKDVATRSTTLAAVLPKARDRAWMGP